MAAYTAKIDLANDRCGGTYVVTWRNVDTVVHKAPVNRLEYRNSGTLRPV